MINIKLDKLKPGMILAKPAYNHQELLLLKAGVKLTEKNIRMFKSWGVSEAWIKGDSSDAGFRNQASGAGGATEIEAELNQKFEDVMDDPIMVTIKQAAGRVLSRHLEEQGQDE